MNSADFIELEKKLAKALGAQAPKISASGSPYKYYADFVQSGENKGKYNADMLLELAKNPDHRLSLEKCGYLSVGGADGSEIAYVMEHTPIRYGVLQDFSSDLWKTVRKTQEALEQQGKTLEVKIGDISQQITTCKNQLLQWRQKGLIDGLVCSAQAVLHELPSRSPGFDIDFLLGEMFWDWQPCLFFCRETCKPEGWPDRVKLSIGSPAIASELLEPFANQVKLYVGTGGSVLRAGPKHITLPSTLAVEMITKMFYLHDYSHELGEQATYWSAPELARKVEANLEAFSPSMVKHETLTTESFEKRYHDLKVNAFDPETNAKLQIPRVFVRILGKRWGESQKQETTSVPSSAVPEEVELTGRTLDDKRFSRLLGQPESEKLDFKSQPYRLDGEILKSKLIKDIVSIANTNPPNQPGYIVIGVGDGIEGGKPKRELLGAPGHPDDAILQELVHDKVQPPPNFLYYPLQYRMKTFGVIEIRATPYIHQCRRSYGELKEGQFYTRKGSRNSVATMADIEALLGERNRIFNRAVSPQSPVISDANRQSATAISADAVAHLPPMLPILRENYLDGVPVVGGKEQLVLEPGFKLVVTFRGAPSRDWKDPPTDIVGLWSAIFVRGIPIDSEPIPLAWPLKVRRRANAEPVSIEDGKDCRCIPSFDVELEFRERGRVHGPVWSRVKEKVVEQFLAERKGMRFIAKVAGPGFGLVQRGSDLLLNCDDYDDWLNSQWPFYRGIENALTKTQVHKLPPIPTMVENDLRTFVENELIATGRLTDLVPASYSKAFENRPIDVESAMLVLQGLIQEELKFGPPGVRGH